MFLTSRDFTVYNNELIKKPGDKGFSFIFFFTQDCPYCDDVKSAFYNLSQSINSGCNFYYCEVDASLQRMTGFTNTPITYVPLLLLFAEGKILTQFFPDENNPQNNEILMKTFLKQSTQQYIAAQNLRTTTRERPSSKDGGSYLNQNKEASMPGYLMPGPNANVTIGIPYNVGYRGKRTCKLVEDAYTSK